MYVIEVIPLTNIPRPNPAVFSYFYTRPLEPLSLVEVPVGKKNVAGLVVATTPAKDAKLALRKSSTFALKEVSRIICKKAVIFAWQLELAHWIGDYYWTSLGGVLKKFIPDYIVNRRVPYPISSQSHGAQKLFLFPDVSFFGKVPFPADAVKMTSLLTKKKEFLLFLDLASGKKIHVVGTRRSLFAPYNRLKEIHIYEETDGNHKSWEQRPRINAVDIVKKLADLHSAKLAYHSTLPSLASYIKKIPYTSLSEKQKNIDVSIVDLTKEKLKSPFSEKVRQMLRDGYMGGKQAIIYVNRRGEGRFLLCRDCGFVPVCAQCDVSLTLHNWVKGRPSRTLLCHHCGYQELPPSMCPRCGSHEIRSYGFGSERVEQELISLFPKARVLRLDSDKATNERTKKEILDEFARRGNFLVATSMLLSSAVQSAELVVALNPDAELNIPDFAQHEKLFFHLWRLRAWARRFLVLQTYSPDHPVFSSVASQHWQGFYREELAVRKALYYPPFSFIIKLTYAGRVESKVAQEAQILYKKLEQAAKSFDPSLFSLLGPAPSFIPRLKGQYRYNILIKIKTTSLHQAQKCKHALLPIVPSLWEIDVDPIDSL